MKNFRTTVMVLAFSFALTGCGTNELGESCDDVGTSDDCVDGAVCSNDSGGNYCRKICGSQADCSSSEACNGITGSNTKSCQPN